MLTSPGFFFKEANLSLVGFKTLWTKENMLWCHDHTSKNVPSDFGPISSSSSGKSSHTHTHTHTHTQYESKLRVKGRKL